MAITSIFKKKRAPADWIPRAPDGVRIYAVGDIHGRLDLLEQLLGLIESDDERRGPADTQLIFLGDLTDRGPHSRSVVERLMTLGAASSNVRFVFGNHEELLLRAAEGDKRAAGVFNRNGGRETILSYGVDPDTYDQATLDDLAEIIPACIPSSHIEFLSGFEDWIVAGDYLFVHAGIRPGRALEEQSQTDLRWIRREFTDYEGPLDHFVIHGHSITQNVDIRPNAIGIDTGAFATGKLSAIGIEGGDRWFLDTAVTA